MKIIDIGVNLMHRSFDIDRENVIDDACFEGVSPLIITGTSERGSINSVNYAQCFSQKLYCTVGIHPHDAKSCGKNTIDTLRKLAKNECVVAIGECGLDYDRDFSPRDVQRTCFENQINLAIELGLPLFLHEREASKDFTEILKSRKDQITKMVVHCFTGSEESLNTYLDLGCHIGITGWICDERRGKNLIGLLKKIPLNRLMIETDAPFLTPRNLPEKTNRNEPKYLIHILEEIANHLGKDIEDLSEITYSNTCRFFAIEE